MRRGRGIAADGGPEVERDVGRAIGVCRHVSEQTRLLDVTKINSSAPTHVHAKAPGARVVEANADVPLTAFWTWTSSHNPKGRAVTIGVRVRSRTCFPRPAVDYARRRTGENRPRGRSRSIHRKRRRTYRVARGSCNSLAHETSSPLVFARFQHWATKMMPSATIRSKAW